MQKIFNSISEVSMRVLLLLDNIDDPISLERITILDFFATFGKDFGFSDKNLHGDGHLNMSEFSARNNIIRKTIVPLQQNHFIIIDGSMLGITYSISKEGRHLCGCSTMDYGKEYRIELEKVLKQTHKLTDDEIFHLLQKKILNKIRGNK